MKAGETLDKTIYRIINERRASGEDTGDLLSMLLQSRDTEGDHSGMTDKQVRDETLTLFIAGHETTATALTGPVPAGPTPRSRSEIGTAKSTKSSATENPHSRTPPSFPTPATLWRTMRLYPPAWAIGRMATMDLEIAGYQIPRKSIVLLSPYTMHRSPKYWPEPDRFHPERRGDRGPRPSQVRLLPLRRWPAPLHRRTLRLDGGG